MAAPQSSEGNHIMQQVNESGRTVTVFSRRHGNDKGPHNQAVSLYGGTAAERKEERHVDAVLRLADANDQSPAERIAALDKRLGKGVGAIKERARLVRQMAAA